MSTTVLGTDGNSPILSDVTRVEIFALSDIYQGGVAKNKYVPKVGDIVLDATTGAQYTVSEVSDMLIPSFVQINAPRTPDLTVEDILIGNGPGTPAETYRCYIDKSVKPYRLTVDQRLSIPGTKARTCIIYRGAIIGGVGTEAISQLYDASNNLVGNVIPLELAAMNEMTNYAVRVIPTMYTMADLVDNEIVTAVIYSDDGVFVSKRQMVVENTQFINKPEAAKRYITGVTLESPFLSEADNHLLQIPLSTVLGSANLFGRVHYSNGDTLRLPVDGMKFQLLGLENFVTTQIGQKIPAILQYNLSSDEAAYNATIVGNRAFVQERYRIQTTKSDGKYALKLYGYPQWVDDVTGFTLKWYLMDLARDIYQEVTSLVTYNDNSAGWKGTAYGVVQQLGVSINMAKVNGIYGNYVHSQTIDIMLNRPGGDHSATVWTVAFETNQNPRYGRDNKCTMQFVNQNLKYLNISQGLKSSNAGDFDTWLDRVFKQTMPLYDPITEIEAPIPNSFALLIGDQRYDHLIEDWDQDLPITDLLNDSTTIYVLFYKRTKTSDLYLSIAGLPVFQNN